MPGPQADSCWRPDRPHAVRAGPRKRQFPPPEHRSLSTYCVLGLHLARVPDSEHTRVLTHAHTDWQGNSEELNSTATLQVLQEAGKWLEGGGHRELQGTSRWQGDASPDTSLPCCPETSAQSRPPTAASWAWILWISDPACRRLQILT